MSIERSLQVVLAVLGILSTILLGMGERSAGLPLMAAAAAVSSLYFTDVKGWIRLSTAVSNLAGAAALTVSLLDYRHVGRENQLLALANLLIYLQCVLFFRQKSDRIYWMLLLLTLLQVAVATVLNMSMWFGILLVAYMFAALLALALFLMFREQRRFEQDDGERNKPHEPRPAQDVAALSPRGASTSKPRWPLAGAHASFAPRWHGSPLKEAIAWSLGRQIIRMGCMTLLLTAVFFVFVPRAGRSNWGDSRGASQHTVGFTEKVTLGEFGEIVENPENVLRMRFLDAVSGKPYDISEIPLLRGSILMRYDGGEWRQSLRFHHDALIPSVAVKPGMVRQEIKIEPLDTATLFAVHPIFRDDADRRRNRELVYDINVDRLSRSQGRSRAQLQYDLLTTGLKGGKQVPITPACREQSAEYDFPELLQLPIHPDQTPKIPQLQALAEQVVKDIPRDRTLARCYKLEEFLRDSGRYRYTLLPPVRNPKVDPIEDFLFRNEQGHCEYFASALTLMLRSVGIRARMVVGFKGADWNPLEKYYYVRQLHAHTWVEVFLPPESLPEWAVSAQGVSPDGTLPLEWAHGGWLRLDPTPGIEAARFVPPSKQFPGFRHVLDYAESLWSGYVLSMDSRRQQEAIFSPIRQSSRSLARILFDKESWQKTFATLWKIMRGQRPDEEGEWFSWQAAILSIAVMLVGVGMWRFVRWCAKLAKRSQGGAAAEQQRRQATAVEFYRRLESLLAKRNIVRPHGQTQREFALAAGDQLAASPLTLAAAPLPRKIADAFYRVRFGRAALDNREAEAVEQALVDLAQAMATEHTA